MSIRPQLAWVLEHVAHDGRVRYCPACRQVRLIGRDCVCGPFSRFEAIAVGITPTALLEVEVKDGDIVLWPNEDRADSYYAYYEPEEK
jgi:hypothetical protein